MDWFERLTGFRERDHDDTHSKLRLDGDRLHCLVNGRQYGIGRLELPALGELRDRARSASGRQGRLSVDIVQGDVRRLHQAPEYAGALFQVASQFNLLEMTSPNVTPEQGVTIYQHDATQGPACAIAAGAATIYRNYFVPVGSSTGQRRDRQLDCLEDIGQDLGAALKRPVGELWAMRNGYALCGRAGIDAITRHLHTLDEAALDELRGKLRVGLHWDVEVTDSPGEQCPVVSQAFCSALPVAYSGIAAGDWEAFACLVLEAAYEATLWAAVINAERTASSTVLLTQLGGGVFGNRDNWIHSATYRALDLVRDRQLDVKLVSYGAPSMALQKLASEFG